MEMDQDEDEIMLSATHQSQFTQSLLLFVSTFIVMYIWILTHLSTDANTIRKTLYPSSNPILRRSRTPTAYISYQGIFGRAWCKVQAQ